MPEVTADKKTKRKIRIAYAWNYIEWGGAQIYFLGIARRLKEKADIDFWMPQGTSAEFLEYCAAEGITCRFLRRSVDAKSQHRIVDKAARHLGKVLSEFEMVRSMGREGYDIVHADLGPWQSVTALVFLSLFHEVFFTMHNRLPEVGMFRSLLWRVKFFLAAISPRLHPLSGNLDAKLAMARYTGPRFVTRTTVASTNIDPDELRGVRNEPAAVREVRGALGVPVEAKLVMTVAQFIDRKGRWVLLRAAGEVARRYPDVYFRWITSSAVSPDDYRTIEEGALGDRFKVVRMAEAGFGRPELLEAIAASDVFVLPSIVEGLPIAIMEAMGLGVPVVATDVNGVSEAFVAGTGGILVNAGDSSGLTEALSPLLSDDAQRKHFGDEARKILQSELTEPVVASVVWRAYLRALGRQE